MSLAAQAVRPLCPYCGRPVRGGVELRDASADVEDLLQVARRRADAGRLEDLELLVITNTDAMESLRLYVAFRLPFAIGSSVRSAGVRGPPRSSSRGRVLFRLERLAVGSRVVS